MAATWQVNGSVVYGNIRTSRFPILSAGRSSFVYMFFLFFLPTSIPLIACCFTLALYLQTQYTAFLLASIQHIYPTYPLLIKIRLCTLSTLGTFTLHSAKSSSTNIGFWSVELERQTSASSPTHVLDACYICRKGYREVYKQKKGKSRVCFLQQPIDNVNRSKDQSLFPTKFPPV